MSNFEKIVKTVRDWIVYLLLFVSAISYHPIIVRMSHAAGYQSGTILSPYIILLFAAAFVLSFSLVTLRNSDIVKKYIFWSVIILVAGLCISAFFQNSALVREMRTFFIILGAIMIGYDMRLNEREFIFLLLSFSLTTLFSGLMQVMIRNGGFRIASLYLTDAKNAIGAMLATSAFVFYYLVRTSKLKIWKLSYLFLTLLTFVIIVTIRARLALVAFVMVLAYHYFLEKRSRNIIITFIAVGVTILLLIVFMPSSFSDYLNASFTAGRQGDDITSGRLSTYRDALLYLSEHPLLGNVEGYNHINWVHNYLLLKLYSYGLLFCWPIWVLYFVLLLRSVMRPLKLPAFSLKTFGYLCLLIPFIISLGEPTFPFGPGTVTVFNFILLGISEKQFSSGQK